MARDGQEAINHEQEFVLQYIVRNHKFVLRNETIGEFLKLEKNQIKLDITTSTDVYYQKDIFEKTYSKIIEELEKIQNIGDFIDKLLDCKLCLLICKDLVETESVERIFLDMNFKLQKLDVEDIFKGYCFQNYRPCFHNELKALWVELKRYSRMFLDWGYEDLSQFLYHYFFIWEREEYNNKKFNGKWDGNTLFGRKRWC